MPLSNSASIPHYCVVRNFHQDTGNGARVQVSIAGVLEARLGLEYCVDSLSAQAFVRGETSGVHGVMVESRE